jgi:glycosyltransferase involved in cell wall biosynthesis
MIKNSSNVVLITNNLYSGGSQRVCVNLSNQLSATHNVDLIVIGKNLNLLNKINKRVNIINLGFNRVSLSFFELFKYFFKNKTKNVISFLNHTNLICMLLKIFFNFNLIITIHNVVKPPSKTKNYKNRIVLFLSKFLFHKANHIISVANYIKIDLEKNFKIKPKTIYNPVIYKKKIDKGLDKKKFLKENKLYNKSYLLHIGRFDEQKNHMFLLEFFKLVSIKYNNKFRLVLLGDGNQRKKIKNKIKELSLQKEVLFMGNVNNPEHFIKYSFCFILTSKWEGLPNVIIENMKFRKPMISAKCPGGINEVLPHGKLGFYVNLNKDIFLNKFKQIVKSKKRSQDYSKIINNFDIETQTEKYRKLLL